MVVEYHNKTVYDCQNVTKRHCTTLWTVSEDGQKVGTVGRIGLNYKRKLIQAVIIFDILILILIFDIFLSRFGRAMKTTAAMSPGKSAVQLTSR